jgi:hypothetical protein
VSSSGHLGEKWENIVGKSMQMKVFEQKLFAHFQDSLKLFFPKDILKMCETPLDLIEYVSKVREVLRLQETFRGRISERNEYHL